MYGSGIESLFTTGTFVFLIVVSALGLWKIIDIIIWLFQHISISWS